MPVGYSLFNTAGYLSAFHTFAKCPEAREIVAKHITQGYQAGHLAALKTKHTVVAAGRKEILLNAFAAHFQGRRPQIGRAHV